MSITEYFLVVAIMAVGQVASWFMGYREGLKQVQRKSGNA